MAPTPIRTAPSSAPLEAMVAKQQTHIDELVAKNRNLEAIVQRLHVDISSEKTRCEDVLHKVKAQYDSERKKWKEESDMIQGLWRVSYLREVVKVENVSRTAMEIRDELRLARLATLQRDYQLEMFRAKESERDNRIAELEDALEDARWESEEILAQYALIEQQGASLEDQLQSQAVELAEAAEEKSQLEKTLQGLRKEHAALLSSSRKDSSAFERTKLELDGVKASHAEMKHKYLEMERSNADLVRQLEKWRTLENRDEEELETLRKRKMELEVEVEELHQAAEMREQKFNAKLQKYKDSLNDHVRAYQECEDENKEQQNEIDQLREQLAYRDQELEGARQELEEVKSHPPSHSKKRPDVGEGPSRKSQSPPPLSPVAPQSRPKPKPKPKPRPRPRPVNATKPKPASDDEIQEIEPPPTTKAKPKKPNKTTPVVQDDDIQEVESPPHAKMKEKPKRKAKEKEKPMDTEVARSERGRGRSAKPKSAMVEDEDDNAPPVETGTPTGKGKRRIEIDDDDEQQQKPRKRSKNMGDGERSTSKTHGKATKARASKHSFLDSEREDEVVQPKKQKRKINLSTHTSLPAAPKLDLPLVPQGGKSLSFDIPMELSPVKEGGPPRTVSALGKNISSLMGAFPGRR